MSPSRSTRPRFGGLWDRRPRWGLTPRGHALAALLLAALAAGAWFGGEEFLALDAPVAPEVLVVEGWIGNTGVRAAAAEFHRGGYRWIVATGGLTDGRWDEQRWSYAEMARRDLLASGVPANAILFAAPDESTARRTLGCALATHAALARLPFRPKHVTIFTLGAHARRSRIVYAGALPEYEVGCLAWRPTPAFAGPWWRSSDRAEDLLKESVGCLLEASRRAVRLLRLTAP